MGEEKQSCKDCGHSLMEHLRNVNGVYCQRCEREGKICEFEKSE